MFALASCVSSNRDVFDEMDAYAAAAGTANGRAEPRPFASPAASPLNPGGAPKTQDRAIPITASSPAPAPALSLPRNAAPAPEIAGLEFLEGRWVAVNANKTVNEEHWMAPRGNTLIGSFRQIRLDGDCSFVEMSQIAVEGEDIVLRLRHLHGRMEVPKGREEISLFRLVSLAKDRVEFAGMAGSEGVTSLVYERRSANELVQSVGFAPETGQESFVTVYTMDR